ncbi:MAG: class I SAM-dependent rRNA methyltransferase [Verrucomicrobiaceae bacterium]|nr:MAG: class I SAM-dependent rRNA methyltransferase [Verrucomicrobiaceae bacterium]
MRELLDAAVAKRKPLLTEQTDAVRLIDGAGDGLPGVFLETFAGRWLLSTTANTVPAAVGEWLRDRGVSCYWKRLDQNQKESPAHFCGPVVSEPFAIRENGIVYEISFHSGYSQGIFLDQRDNRAEVRRRMKPGLRLLNTFAYTGAFSVAAAMAGAETTTLDLSQPYLDWARRNLCHNSLDPAAHHFCKGDTFHWLRRFAKQGRLFDGIVLDPPTFSRDEKGKVFRVENDFGELAALAARVLAPGGWLLCCTNFRGMTPGGFERQLTASLPRPMSAHHTPMPPDFTDAAYLKSVWLE